MSNTKILIVDDELIMRESLADWLELDGYLTDKAASGEEALEIARKTKPALILLDIMMSGIDGFEVCRLLKNDSSTRDAAVIFLSGLDDTRDKVQGFRLGPVSLPGSPLTL